MCSVDKKLARGVALAVLAVALMGSQAALAGEPTGEAAGVVAPTSTPNPTREPVSAPAAVDSKAGPVVPGPGPSVQEATKVKRAALRTRRLRRDEDRAGRGDDSRQSRIREASADRPRARYEVPWHRNGGGVGLILGVGF
jgi:hypothetical protein